MTSHEPFDDLEAELLALGDAIDVPTPPPSDVAAAVRARLEALAAGPTPDDSAPDSPSPDDNATPDDSTVPDDNATPDDGAAQSRPHPPAPGRRDDDQRRPARRGRRRRWAIVAAVVAVVVAITAATPQGRAAVAHILRLAGVEVRVGGGPLPTFTPSPLPGERTIEPDKLSGMVKFRVSYPAALGEPDEIRISDKGRVVSMFWGKIRLDQFDGGFDPGFFKELGGEPWPEYVRLRAGEAWWIAQVHRLSYLKRGDGTPLPLRMAAETLLWEKNGIGFRLEGVKDKDRAAEIASSLR